MDTLKNLVTLYLHHPEEFSYGILANSSVPGVLLHGPPGVGKTHLVKAVAKESGASVLSISGADIFQTWLGEGEKVVRATFSLARKLQPCIIFCDEADAIFRVRSADDKPWIRSVLTQFVQLWDGFTTDPSKWVLVILATNRPYDLDEAVLRRLPRKIFIDVPDAIGREAILRIHLRDETLDPDVNLAVIAASTPSFTGSDLKDVCVAAAYSRVSEESQANVAQMRSQSHSSSNGSTRSHRRRRIL